MNHLSAIRDKILANCNFIISDGEAQYIDQILALNQYFVSLITPKNMDGDSHYNIIIQFRINFEELCIALMANGIQSPDKMTVLRFYAALKYFEAKKRANGKSN
jgi:hypothetical protein